LYELMASRFEAGIPWSDVHLFWADERWVPAGDARSNYRMARAALIDHVPCPSENVHPMPTSLPDPDAGARAYEAMLRSWFVDGPVRFDVVLLGIGSDGHTASLFPGSPALREEARPVVAVTAAAADPPVRLTLTWPALLHAGHIHVLATGSGKARAVDCAVRSQPDVDACPASTLRQATGLVTWWIDREAAGHE
jgi:6-phosphogluconolactonase